VRLLRSNFAGPVNIESQEIVTINQLVDLVADIAGKTDREEACSRAARSARAQLG
jgi:nucleoside-diphosphate-sugar epimerase